MYTQMNTEGPTIATLPEDPYADPPSPEPAIQNDQLNMAAYSDKSFVVFGEATKIHKESLGRNGLGGKFNGKLSAKPGFPGGPAYIYYIKLKDQVRDFVNQVNTGTVPTQNQPPAQGTFVTTLPTAVVPLRNQTYQTVRWKVFRPAEGMKVSIKVGGSKLDGEVLQTEMTGNIVDTAYISAGGNTSKVVICSGKWQVWGYQAEHTVFFSPQTNSPTPSPQPTHDTNPGYYQRQNEYDDIANV